MKQSNRRVRQKLRRETARRTSQVTSILTDFEIQVLADHFHDDQTCVSIAEQTGKCRQYISKVIKEACEKLEGAGLPIPTHHEGGRLYFVTDSTIDQHASGTNR